MQLSTCQENARKKFKDFLRSDEQFFILTGGPGRGKSFMTKLLLEDVSEYYLQDSILPTATTNKAAKVVSDFIGYDTITIHSLLGLRVKNNLGTGKTNLIRSPAAKVIHDSFIQIDEISMMDDPLLIELAKGTCNCRFLLVGDKDQLAPITSSKPPVFHKGYTRATLNTPMRFGGAINALAEQFKETIETGIFKPIEFNNDNLIKVSGEEFRKLVDKTFTLSSPPDANKIICWKNETVRSYNDYIRGQHYNEENFTVGETVVTNQPIMHQNLSLYSTDELAKVVSVSSGCEHGIDGYWYKLERGCLVFQASNQRLVKSKLKQLANEALSGSGWSQYFIVKEFFADLRAVHACTTYKSQGSSYDTVFIDLEDIGECKNWEQVARQIYVAISRAKSKVYFYGQLPPKYSSSVW